MRTSVCLMSFSAVLVLILACRQTTHAAAAPVTAATAEIKIDNFTFIPATLKVAVGTQVTWINHDDIPHSVVTDDKSIKSKALDTDEKFTFTFTKPGTYSYFCGLHPKMKGSIVVE